MTIPASLIEVRDKCAKEWFHKYYGDDEYEVWESGDFIAGFNAAIAHLQSLGGEFDERAAEEKGHLLASRVSKTYSISPNAHVILQGNSFIDGARWMRSEMLARVVAHQLHEEATVVQANDKIKALEAELNDLKVDRK